MDSDSEDKGKDGKDMTAGACGQGVRKTSPDWATGLRRLYDSVVDEPLPDNFKDLLSKLDKHD